MDEEGEEMTREEILAMDPGYEMDVLIATKIMGIKFPAVEEMKTEAYEQWKIQAHCRHFLMGFEAWIENGEFKYRYKTKLYSTMISAAWEVVEKFPLVDLSRIEFIEGEVTYEAKFWNDFAEGTEPYELSAKTAPLAICRCALLAVLEATPC